MHFIALFYSEKIGIISAFISRIFSNGTSKNAAFTCGIVFCFRPRYPTTAARKRQLGPRQLLYGTLYKLRCRGSVTLSIHLYYLIFSHPFHPSGRRAYPIKSSCNDIVQRKGEQKGSKRGISSLCLCNFHYISMASIASSSASPSLFRPHVPAHLRHHASLRLLLFPPPFGCLAIRASGAGGRRIKSYSHDDENNPARLRRPLALSHSPEDGRDSPFDSCEIPPQDRSRRVKDEEWVDWEDLILQETVPLVGFVRMILHPGK